jgi:hypothetical protein
VALEQWGSSGFANTDSDLQLKKHGIHQLIVSMEATVRYAADFSDEAVFPERQQTWSCPDNPLAGVMHMPISFHIGGRRPRLPSVSAAGAMATPAEAMASAATEAARPAAVTARATARLRRIRTRRALISTRV